MLKIIKNTMYRIGHNKAFLIVYLILIPVVIGLAVYLTNSISYNLHVGIVGDIQVVANEQVRYEYLENAPETSELVLSQYDAVLVEEDQQVKVISTKGEEFDQGVLMLVYGQLDTLQDQSTQRGNASNIIGFLMMVVSLLGVQIYQYYFDERKGINKRIMGTSIRTSQYMLSHFIVVLGFLFIPAVIVVCGALFLFDITITFALWKFIASLFLLCFFATSFGLWINSLSKSIEESMMFGNMFAIAGSIISGGLAQVTNNEIFNRIVQILPQKQIMSLLEALENHTAIPYVGILYVIGISVILIIFAIYIEKRKLPFR